MSGALGSLLRGFSFIGNAIRPAHRETRRRNPAITGGNLINDQDYSKTIKSRGIEEYKGSCTQINGSFFFIGKIILTTPDRKNIFMRSEKIIDEPGTKRTDQGRGQADLKQDHELTTLAKSHRQKREIQTIKTTPRADQKAGSLDNGARG